MTQTKKPSLNDVSTYSANMVTQVDQKADGILAELRQMRTEITERIDSAKDATLAAIKKPEAWTDRFLDWWRAKDASWLGWVVLAFIIAVAASIGRATA